LIDYIYRGPWYELIKNEATNLVLSGDYHLTIDDTYDYKLKKYIIKGYAINIFKNNSKLRFDNLHANKTVSLSHSYLPSASYDIGLDYYGFFNQNLKNIISEIRNNNSSSAKLKEYVNKYFIITKYFVCEHSKRIDAAKEILRDLNFLLKADDKTLKEIKSSLARILWYINNSVSYKRGQAGIAKWLIQDLAKLNGYTYRWNKEKAHGLPDDQAALSIFTVEEFVQKCLDNDWIILDPL